MLNIYDELFEQRVIPVIKIEYIEDALPLAKALMDAGFKVLEITFRSAIASEAIKKINENYPELILLAGTVLSPEMAQEALDSGSKGIVSPGFNLDTVRWCKKNKAFIIPGVATPTELEGAIREGLDLVKLFPAESLGGVNYIKDLSGPYRKMRFFATGGINNSNIENYLKQSNLLCCGGSWLIRKEDLEKKNFDIIEKFARIELQKIKDLSR